MCSRSIRWSPVTGLVAAAVLLLAGCRDESAPATAPGTQPEVAAVFAAPAFDVLSAGRESTCGLTGAGRAYCWGSNVAGQLGDGTTTSRLTPAPVSGGLAFRAISTGAAHTCAVTTEGRAYCWGRGAFLGIPSPPLTSTVPVAVATSLRFQAVYAAMSHTCGVTEGDRRAFCWGNGSAGELGDGSREYRATPVPVAGTRAWRQMAPGAKFTCGITTARKAFCWGADDVGQLGDNATSARHITPVWVAGDHLFDQIDADKEHTCAVDANTRAWCWGFGRASQLGNGDLNNRFTPKIVDVSFSFRRVNAGESHTCGERIDGVAYCWGLNTYGELGSGATTPPFRAPFEITGGIVFAQVTAGGDHSCGRTSEGVSYCWGRNTNGQLGDGTMTDRTVPTLVVGP